MWVLFANRGLLLDKTQFTLDITSNIRIYSNLLLNLFFNFWFFEIFFREIIFFSPKDYLWSCGTDDSFPYKCGSYIRFRCGSVRVSFQKFPSRRRVPTSLLQMFSALNKTAQLSFFFNSLFRKRRQTFQDFAVNPNFWLYIRTKLCFIKEEAEVRILSVPMLFHPK